MFSLATVSWSAAQSTVFNIPSTDVQAHKSTYLELDFTAHVSSFETGGYHAYGPRLVYGLNKKLEVGINAFYPIPRRLSQPKSSQTSRRSFIKTKTAAWL